MNVSPELEFDRALATIGLLRHVTNAVPLDAVCVYSNQTQQGYGIRRYTQRLGYCCYYFKERQQLTVDDDKEQSEQIVVPNSLIKMTKDYIIRAFWDQIDHLRDCSVINPTDEACRHEGGQHRTMLKTFPKEVLNTVAALKVSQYASLWDSKNAIEALHSVCVPDTYESPAYIKSPASDVMRNEHHRSIIQLFSILNNYCWNANNRMSIPNEAEKKLLLDLIESLAIMFGCGSCDGFFGNAARKQVYEFARRTDKLERGKHLRVLSYRGSSFDTRVGAGWNSAFTSKYIEDTRHMSPEAVICLKTFVSGSPKDCAQLSTFVPNPAELAKLRPQPLNEVAIYIRNESSLSFYKTRHIQEEIERRKRYLDGECCDAPCCAEPEAPCSY